MDWILVCVQKTNCERLDACTDEAVDARKQVRLVEWREDAAVGIDTLQSLASQVSRHERYRLGVEQVVHLRPVESLNLEHVAEPRGRHEPRPGATALEKRVERHGRAVAEEPDLRFVDSRL